MSFFYTFVGLAVGSMLLTSSLIPLIRGWAKASGLVDDPEDESYKTHAHTTPYGGGVAIFIGAMVPLLGVTAWLGWNRADAFLEGGMWVDLWAPYALFPLAPDSPTIEQLSQILSLFVAATLMFLVGWIDDRRSLSPGIRFTAQIMTAGTMAGLVPGFQLDLLGSATVAWLGATLWIAALTNAFNFLDNMNGLAAGLAAIALAALGATAVASEHVPAAVLSVILIGAASGFLIYNFPVASIFMGDSGGLFLGYCVGGLSVLLSHRFGELGFVDTTMPYRLIPLMVLVVPVYDLVSVVLLRLRRGRPPWLGDTNHISHRIVRLGLEPTHAVLAVHTVASVLILPCLIVLHVGPGMAWRILGGVLAAIIAAAAADYISLRRDPA
ncbi:MAG: MraY family glycosyltransferase [Candidatus Latescibacterota bacterium]|nr:MraY family glycosyltransferase [Candidatus Latescibacterota bacterium]